jgi:DNA repair photolyase
MPNYLNLNVVLRYDFIITYLAVVFFINLVLANFRITRLSNVFRPGNQVTIVTKPHLDCVKAICPEFPDYRGKILFRFTIGSSDSNTLKFWEPSVPDFAERLESLKFAYEQGFQTSVSSEPILDDNIGDVIDRVSPFVTDSIWLGKMNHLRGRLALNGETDPVTMQKAEQLIVWQSDENIKQLYSRYKNNPLVKWKDSVKKVLGLSISTEAGMDS